MAPHRFIICSHQDFKDSIQLLSQPAKDKNHMGRNWRFAFIFACGMVNVWVSKGNTYSSIITSFLIGGAVFTSLIVTFPSPVTFYGKHQSLGHFLSFFQISMGPWPMVCIFSVKSKKPAFLPFSATSSHTVDIIQWPWKFEIKASHFISKLRPRTAGLEWSLS